MFGEMVSLGHGGNGFREIYHSALEFKIYTDPAQSEEEYFHYQIPGKASECISR